jgi:hypothetical protein
MSIYEKPVRLLFRDMIKDLALQKGKIFSKSDVTNWFAKKYPKIKEGTISAHLLRFSTNAPSRVHYNAKPGDDDLFFQVDGSHFRLYEQGTDPSPIEKNGTVAKPEIPLPDDDQPQDMTPSQEFAYEADLRDFLAKNLGLLESGLHLYEEEGITGVEFPVGGRYVDILAVDASGDYVVVELKVSRGYDRVVGQLLRYTSWIAKHHAEPSQKVRGIIVAREISDDLLLACSRLTDVSLFEYQLSVTLKKV